MMNRLLITGAAGSLGTAAREHLGGFAEHIRLSDMDDISDLGTGEEFVRADLGDADAVSDLVAGCDGIVHFGGVSYERGFDVIENANIRGVFNLYQAANEHGRPRIVFASSNHAIGFYRTDRMLDGTEPPVADGLYGASKVYGEQLALVYFHKFGIETARVRIGSCFAEPRNRRMLSTWLSHRDMFDLVRRVFTVPRLGCPVIYGMSDNTSRYWDNSSVAYLGWQPRDSSEPWRQAIEAAEPRGEADAPEALFQGGTFTADIIHKD